MRRFLLAVAVAPLGAGLVYGVLVTLHPLGERDGAIGFLTTICVVAYVAELIAAIPTYLAYRGGHAGVWILPIASSVAAGVLVTQVFGIPAMSFGGWSTAHPRLSEVVSAGLVFSMVGLLKSLVLVRSTKEADPKSNGTTRLQLAAAVVGGLLIVGTTSLLWRELTVFWLSPAQIESYLLRQTPLGASEMDVTRWLDTRGRQTVPIKANIPPNSDYPLTRTGGAAAIHLTVAEYRLIFWAAVEAFYVFDQSGHLVDVRVRRTIDSL
jgi:hypothetical protein